MGMIRLSDKPPVTVVAQDSIYAAARTMTEKKTGAAVVVDGTKAIGIITERDVLQKVIVKPQILRPRTCETS